ncbi:DUF3450 domain-containing protein [Parendozoicomonas haliclonae]|uniref:DUF3450 domain-containing protein n=1 Tax=Parendozoicomonas haliclonae TaxID=1960125 RepID=A0A1X7AI62_9GAMM|nr:DUF3450 domain-containing protein [Parendozoicomonas haliclonae]SMA44194.1 hypothetical protein EHSB41UT_01753 [Parendozoicomonas haliclonae]
MKIKTHKVKSLCGMLALSSAALTMSMAGSSYAEETLSSVMSTQKKIDVASQKSQNKIDNLSAQTQELLGEYKAVIRQVEAMRIYNRQLQRVVNSQQADIDSMLAQLETLDQTNVEITPLMLKMIDSLEEFIELDVPFQIDERRDRVALLRKTMDRADVTTSEKYRKILEAYQIENDFGRNIEAYKASLGEGEDTRTYQFLRIGRLALMYQSLDGEETGHWNKQTRQFEVLPETYRSGVAQGLKIALKQAPPNLIKLPVHAAEGA